MIRIRPFFPPPIRNQAIMTELSCQKPNKSYHCSLSKPSLMNTTLLINKKSTSSKYFYPKNKSRFRRIQNKFHDKMRVLENRVLGIPLSEKDLKIMNQEINFFHNEKSGKIEVIRISMEKIFQYFLQFKKTELKWIILNGQLRNKLIKPFLVLFQKLNLESDEGCLFIQNQNPKTTLLNMFTKFNPKQMVDSEIQNLNTKYKSFYQNIFQQYQQVPFFGERKSDHISIPSTKLTKKMPSRNKQIELNQFQQSSKNQSKKSSKQSQKHLQDAIIKLRFNDNLRNERNKIKKRSLMFYVQ